MILTPVMVSMIFRNLIKTVSAGEFLIFLNTVFLKA